MSSPAATPSPAEPELSAGQKLIELILGSQDWIHRQVERVEIQPTGDVLHQVSLDLTVPPGLELPGSRGAVQVPVTLLSKGPLSQFSVIGPEDHPAPLLESAANSALAETFLRTLARVTYGFSAETEPVEVGILLADIVSSDRRRGRLAIERLRRLLDGAPTGPTADPLEVATFFSMVEVFARRFLMVIELDASLVGRRCIVKYSYLDFRDDSHDRPRYEMSWDVGHFGVAASYHFELVSPQLLEITSLTIVEVTGDEITPRAAEPPSVGVGVVHLAVRPRSRLSTAAIVAALVPRRYGVVSQSFVGAWLVTLVLASIIGGRHLRDLWNPGATVAPTAAGVLSAGGAIVLTWIARTPEDRIVAAVLRRPRRHLLGAGALLIAAGLYMAVPVPEPARTVGWWLLLTASLAVAVAATVHRVLSRPGPVPGGSSPARARRRTLDVRMRHSDDGDGEDGAEHGHP